MPAHGRSAESGPRPGPAQSAAVRRLLRRAARGETLNRDEVVGLLALRGGALADAQALAREVRARALVEQGRPGVITYSPKVFVPLTRLCRDRCGYCTFASDPASLRREGVQPYLELDEVEGIAARGAAAGCREALFTLGDRPEDRWPAARLWLEERGYASTIDYLRAAAVRVLETTGLLPHLNPGVMTWQELVRLRPVAPSMGIMLETTSRRLFETPGAPHYGSPDKDPRVRERVITDAGRLEIPLTTGLLVGIGETREELADSLLTLRSLTRHGRHIGEVIIQNFRAKPDTALRHSDDLPLVEYAAALTATRLLLGPHVAVQAPPNLTDARELGVLLDSGVDDWGGISPVTPDHVNPERPWPHLDTVAQVTQENGLTLGPRLAVHPRFVRALHRWVDPRLHAHVTSLADDTGLLDRDREAQGRPWQEPDSYQQFAGASPAGRTDLAITIDTVGRRSAGRGDGDVVHGDWTEVKAGLPARWDLPPRTGRKLDAEMKSALRRAEVEPASLAEPQHEAAAVCLAQAEGEALEALCAIADGWRAEIAGDDVTYVVNRNINFTNVCYTGCRFCAFAQRENDPDAFTLSLAQVGARVDEAVAAGATEICMQGGIHPRMPANAYFDLAREVTAREVHLHAFSPMEVVTAAARSKMSIEAWLDQARSAGVGSLPGTAAEILDDDIRWVLTKGKLPTADWVEVITTAHRLGLPTTSTMMYGHVDAPHHWVGHLRVLRRIQEQTGGFTEFVALPFVHHNAPLYLAGLARPGPSARDDLAVVALARVLLAGAIDNIQVSWVKAGPEACAAMLGAGANDLGGTLMEETISRMAGSEHGSAMTPEQLSQIARRAGRPARERTTLYDVVPATPPVPVSAHAGTGRRPA